MTLSKLFGINSVDLIHRLMLTKELQTLQVYDGLFQKETIVINVQVVGMVVALHRSSTKTLFDGIYD
jgi:hypothetical protein